MLVVHISTSQGESTTPHASDVGAGATWSTARGVAHVRAVFRDARSGT
jgi:hypothetical protein